MSANFSQNFINKLNNWFNGLIALPLLAVGYGYLEIFSGRLKGLYSIDIYSTLVLLTLLLIYTVYSTRNYVIKIKTIDKDVKLALKLDEYFEVAKSFYVKVFIVGLLAVVGLFITGSVAYAGFYAGLLFLLSVYRPSLLTIANKLGLEGEERSAFLKKSSTTLN